jgi:hypothetical protein
MLNFVPKSTNFTFRSRKDQIGGDIFDMLLSFSDFLTFKQMFLDYKAVSFLERIICTFSNKTIKPFSHNLSNLYKLYLLLIFFSRTKKEGMLI